MCGLWFEEVENGIERHADSWLSRDEESENQLKRKFDEQELADGAEQKAAALQQARIQSQMKSSSWSNPNTKRRRRES